MLLCFGEAANTLAPPLTMSEDRAVIAVSMLLLTITLNADSATPSLLTPLLGPSPGDCELIIFSVLLFLFLSVLVGEIEDGIKGELRLLLLLFVSLLFVV